MAGGWARDGAVQEQIDASVADAVRLAREQLPEGESLLCCQECDEDIPELRGQAMPGVRYCVQCQSELEKLMSHSMGFNRKGSKDSQLK
ncbi:MAG: DksA/TraR family C4-type zinc finger protein [Gammaproteobacteria bacterium]|nr:DksA/TraR family C4-type zinc finger protein [Kiritimatiellia bacterium]NKB63512.1 DksA/TraR family C4-type zinc finger protein [Gammaproteobacteria bacterium]